MRHHVMYHMMTQLAIDTTISDHSKLRLSDEHKNVHNVTGQAGSVQICPSLPLYPLGFQCLNSGHNLLQTAWLSHILSPPSAFRHATG